MLSSLIIKFVSYFLLVLMLINQEENFLDEVWLEI